MKYLQFEQPGLGVGLLGHDLSAHRVGPRSLRCLKIQSRFKAGQDYRTLDAAGLTFILGNHLSHRLLLFLEYTVTKGSGQ